VVTNLVGYNLDPLDHYDRSFIRQHRGDAIMKCGVPDLSDLWDPSAITALILVPDQVAHGSSLPPLFAFCWCPVPQVHNYFIPEA